MLLSQLWANEKEKYDNYKVLSQGLLFTSLSWFFLILVFLSCVVCTFTFLYIVFFVRDSLSPHIHLMLNSLIGLHRIYGWRNIWKNIWMEEYLDGPRCWWCCGPQPVSCLRKPPSILMDKTLGTSLLIAQLRVWFFLMFLFVSCFRTNVPKWEREKHSRTFCSGSLMSSAAL